MRTRAVWWSAAVAAVVVGVAGCGGSPGGEVVTDPTTAGVVEPATPDGAGDAEEEATGPAEPVDPPEVLVPPEKPEAMSRGDEAGARAAADYLLELYPYIYQSGDAHLLLEFCDDESSLCANAASRVAQNSKNAVTVFGGELSWVDRVSVSRVEPSDSLAFEVEGDVWESVSYTMDARGERSRDAAERVVAVYLIVYWTNDGWRLFDGTAIDASEGES